MPVDGVPAHLSETDWEIRNGAPCLGQHTRQVLTQVLGKDDASAGSVVYISRPRGYFGAGRDIIELGGQPAPGIPDGVPTLATSRLAFPDGPQQSVPGRFNDERIPARTWPMKENRVTLIELTW